MTSCYDQKKQNITTASMNNDLHRDKTIGTVLWNTRKILQGSLLLLKKLLLILKQIWKTGARHMVQYDTFFRCCHIVAFRNQIGVLDEWGTFREGQYLQGNMGLQKSIWG